MPEGTYRVPTRAELLSVLWRTYRRRMMRTAVELSAAIARGESGSEEARRWAQLEALTYGDATPGSIDPAEWADVCDAFLAARRV